jgi:hypothetical protein
MKLASAPDFDSTLIRRGLQASTYTEMTQFAEIIETRPLDKLLVELPSLAELSEAKFNLARNVIRHRSRELPEVEREQLRMMAGEVASSAGIELGPKIRDIFS